MAGLFMSMTLRAGKKWCRYRPGVAQRVGRGIALLFHDRGTRRGRVVSSTPRPHFTPGKEPVPILQESGWAPGPVWTGGISRPLRDSIPDRPALSQSLCRLSYAVHRGRKTRNKTQADIEWPEGNKEVLEVERGSTRSHCPENSCWKWLWSVVKLRDDDYAFKIFGTGMCKVYAEITKKLKKIQWKCKCFGCLIKPRHDLLQCGEFWSLFGHADKKASRYWSTRVYTMLSAARKGSHKLKYSLI